MKTSEFLWRCAGGLWVKFQLWRAKGWYQLNRDCRNNPNVWRHEFLSAVVRSKWPDALNIANRWVVVQPRQAKAWFALGVAWSLLRKPQEAAQAFGCSDAIEPLCGSDERWIKVARSNSCQRTLVSV